MHKYLSIDIRKCTNCRTCEIWCAFNKTGEANPAYSRIQIWDRLKEGVAVPIVCNHCDEAFCQAVCPTKAIKRDTVTGAVILDMNLCIGCRACVLACPFGAMLIDPDGKVMKCDLCQGLPEPVCYSRCPKGAIIWEQPERLTRSKQKKHTAKLIESLSSQV